MVTAYSIGGCYTFRVTTLMLSTLSRWAECLLPNSIKHRAPKGICSLKICSLRKCPYKDILWVIWKHASIGFEELAGATLKGSSPSPCNLRWGDWASSSDSSPPGSPHATCRPPLSCHCGHTLPINKLRSQIRDIWVDTVYLHQVTSS